jgi:hypothetical protein
MTLEQSMYAGAAVAGGVFVAWGPLVSAARSAGGRLAGLLSSGAPRRHASVATYQSAIASLASVRSRLVATGGLTEPVKSAIDTLTLALVAGSDE